MKKKLALIAILLLLIVFGAGMTYSIFSDAALANTTSELATFLKGNEVKLATSLKHGLVAPFSFAKKQLGLPLEYLVPYLFHFGRGGSGKTTMARIPLYFYGEPDSQTNDLGGAEFDTVPRFGERVSKFTFTTFITIFI